MLFQLTRVIDEHLFWADAEPIGEVLLQVLLMVAPCKHISLLIVHSGEFRVAPQLFLR